MAKSTAEVLAQKFPPTRKTKRRSILMLLWKRNKGYLNRKTNSFFFDILEVLSLALLADVNSLKYLYLIWVIFYFAQGILESLFYSARKSYVFEKEIPSQRALLYIHSLVISVPLLFLLISIEKFSANNIAMTYLFYKSTILLVSVMYSYLNFKVQTLARVYYPPILNWCLLTGSIVLVILSHNYLTNVVSFYLTLVIVALTRFTQEVVINKKSKNFADSILWKLKEQKIKTTHSIKEFFILMAIELLIPLGFLLNLSNNLNVKNMFHISLAYMLTKLVMRPMRSLILDYWSLKKETNKLIHVLTFSTGIISFGIVLMMSSAPPFLTGLGFVYFSLLLLWNAKLLNSKFLITLIMLSIGYLLTNTNMLFLAIFFITIFVTIIVVKNSPPKNLLKNKTIRCFEDKFIINFKENTNWDQLARKYPQIRWQPLGKKLCLIEAKNNLEAVESFIYQKSFDLSKIEPLTTDLAKKYNLI